MNLQSSISIPRRHKAVLGVPVQGTLTCTERRGSLIERLGSLMVSTTACHAGGRRFDSRTGNMTLLGVKTWLSTLEIVNLCVFRMIH